jgi:hypothetical protein
MRKRQIGKYQKLFETTLSDCPRLADFGGIEPRSISAPIPLTAKSITTLAGVPRS